MVKDWHDATICGLPGRMRIHTLGNKPAHLFHTQTWKSDPRPIKGYGTNGEMRVSVRYDDECGNGHNTFAITADVTTAESKRRRDIAAGGCLHDEIAQVFHELAHLIRWHLVSSDGPLHYIANTCYHASDRDHNGLLKGESRQIRNSKTGQLAWILKGCSTQRHYGDAPPSDPIPPMKWEPWCTVGEGKARELDHARSTAVWPDATDETLCLPRTELAAILAARLPTLLENFRATITSTGFAWRPAP